MRQIPGGRWGLTWLVTALLLVGSAIGLELFVRARGYQPSVKEDNYSWALERYRASDNSHHTVAILGASRILLAFSGSAFHERLPDYKFVMLALQGSAPVGSLRDLALDPEFRGVALVAVHEVGFLPWNWPLQDAVIATYHRGWRIAGQLAERWLSTQVQSRVALLASNGLRTLRSLLARGAWPKPPHTTTFADRTKFTYFSAVDVERKRRMRLERIAEAASEVTDADSWLVGALAQEIYVLLIQARGGQVVYVRMPTCDERWEFDERMLPKAQFWDRFASMTRAVTVHFKDEPALSSFECPDTSHIASKDGPAFTRGLIDALSRRGVFPR
jgi:hypothetical protein